MILFSIIFLTFVLFGILVVNIFYKNSWYMFAIWWICVGISSLYFTAGYHGEIYVTVVTMIIGGYNLVRIVAPLKKGN